jgi:simple sugar transport system ATP-binding protein
MSDYTIEMLNITKSFPGVLANDNVTLRVRHHEIHALLGENGAGKSTLVSVLFGMYEPDSGEILLDGKKVTIKGPRHANDMGIGMVHQHFMLIRNFTVLENIILGVETEKFGMLRMKEAREKIFMLSKKYGLQVDVDAYISDISVGMQQRAEILKMLYRDNHIMIFDEPTAVLTPQEIDELMTIMKNLAREGKSIVFITHKLDEIKKAADKCTVLRHGKSIGTVDVADVSKEEMSEMMVGRKIDFFYNKNKQRLGKPLLEIENIQVSSKHNKTVNILGPLSLTVRQGEIVSIAGVEGNGQSELAQAISGLIAADSGSVKLLGTNINRMSIRYRNTHGIAYIPEDRHKHGLVLDSSLEENLSLKKYFTPAFHSFGFIRFSQWKSHADTLIAKFDVRSGQGSQTIVRSMSGGNQQKAILAREIDADQDVILAVQPTRGLDVGAIEYIHHQLIEQRDKGKGILLISFELEEILNVSDRVLVLYKGQIAAELLPCKTTMREIGLYMSGGLEAKPQNMDLR